MKKLVATTLVVALLFVAGAVWAQEGTETTPSAKRIKQLPDPGITPDSPLYFFDTLFERMGLFFARGAEAKARKALAISEEKLAEAKVMADQGKEDAAEVAANRYGETISVVAGALAQAAKTGEAFDEALKSLIAKATSVHLSVLSEVYEKVPEKAKPAIEKAMEKSSRGSEGAMKAIELKETRERVREEVKERRQEVKERLEKLRERGILVPSLPPFGPLEGEEGERGVPGGPSEKVRPTPPVSPVAPIVPGAGEGVEEGGPPEELPGPARGRGR